MRTDYSSYSRPRGTAAGNPKLAYHLPVLLVVLTLNTVSVFASSPGAEENVDFSRDVLPIFSDNCLLCHGPDAKTRKADLRLDVKESVLRSKDPIIVPGKGGESELILRITSSDPEEVMPPPKSGRKLTSHQIETLRRWVDQGAKWGKHWAFETPKKPALPPVRNSNWPRNPIDHFVLARLEAEGLTPSAEADRLTLIRRATLDLTGLPPTLEEIDAFLASTSPNAYEELVDRLLASPAYGERMAMDWLDGARFADTNGYQNDFARTMWPWRDWVIAAFNRNQPFDQFLIEQIAGDLLPNATISQKVATGFNRNNRTVTEAGSIDEEWRIENAVDRVETTATVFLGLTLGCARCHDHKYDPISQKEFYQFLDFFNSLNEKGVYTEQRGNVPPLLAVPSPRDSAELKRLDDAITAAAEELKKQESALPDRMKTWEREKQSGPAPAESRDWAFRCPLDGDLRFLGSTGESVVGLYRGKGMPVWTDGPLSQAIRLDGQESSFLEAEQGISLDRTDRFSYGGWIRPRGDGACLSKMDDQAGYRGFDLLVSQGKVEIHLVHSWPGNAVKVMTKEPLPRDAWSHVFVTYDGSGKAAGVSVYLNGRQAKLDVQADQLTDTISTRQPLRLGKRSTSSPFHGDLSDLRIYRRALEASEIRELAELPVLAIANLPANTRSKSQQERLIGYFRDHVDTSFRDAAARLTRLREERAAAEKRIPTVMVMEDLAKPRPTFVLKRGQYDMPDTRQQVGPDTPSSLSSLPADAPRNRLGLARWLVAPNNPLTARVAMNRFWQHHFGTGLVKTAENFGLQGEAPSHPALLDWLATEFVRTGWNMKAMHRLMVTSAAYRQTSKAPPALLQRDPENLLLARGPRFRLSAEVVRDNALAISGLLTARIGGPSVKPYQPAGLWEELAGGAGEGPYVQDRGAELYRRSLYIYRKRTVPHPAMATFDAPSREVCQVKRARTNTPLQALELLNDVTYVEAATKLAELMITQGGSSPEDRLNYAFRRATARPPSPAERKVALRGLQRYLVKFRDDAQAAAEFVRHGEHPVAPGIAPAELAAYTAAASVILNLDETITLE